MCFIILIYISIIIICFMNMYELIYVLISHKLKQDVAKSFAELQGVVSQLLPWLSEVGAIYIYTTI